MLSSKNLLLSCCAKIIYFNKWGNIQRINEIFHFLNSLNSIRIKNLELHKNVCKTFDYCCPPIREDNMNAFKYH